MNSNRVGLNIRIIIPQWYTLDHLLHLNGHLLDKPCFAPWNCHPGSSPRCFHLMIVGAPCFLSATHLLGLSSQQHDSLWIYSHTICFWVVKKTSFKSPQEWCASKSKGIRKNERFPTCIHHHSRVVRSLWGCYNLSRRIIYSQNTYKSYEHMMYLVT